MESLNKIKRKKIPKSVHEMSKEMLQETLRKKKVCNAKAQETVEMLCELEISEEWFLDNLQFINQSHFEDVTVERAILRICGYPLCNNEIRKVWSQQYHISTKCNKVFDLTERKNFCSSSCYKAAMFVKNQLFTSPLWFRDQEVIPKYSIMKSSQKEITPISDEKLHYDDTEAIEVPKNKFKNTEVATNKHCKNLSISNESNNKLVSSKHENCAKILTVENIQQNKDEINEECESNCAVQETMQSKSKSMEQTEILTKSEIMKLEGNLERLKVSESERNFDENKERRKVNTEHKILEKLTNTTSGKNLKIGSEKTNGKRVLDGLAKIETSVFEWFSLDTLFFLFEEKKLQKLFNDKTNQLKEALNAKLSIATYDEKIEKLIKLYSLFETDSFNSDGVRKNLNPLPNYLMLQEESKSIEIKVKSFYTGKLEMHEPSDNQNINPEKNLEEENNICLPLIDSHAQNALRRKIVLDKLNKVLPELLKMFSSDYILQISQVRKLVSTFSLTAHNITFKPTEWSLVGLIVIKLLSLKDKYLDIILKLEQSQEQLKVLLTSFNLKPNYLNSLIDSLTDSKNIMKKLENI